MPALQTEAAGAGERLMGDLRQSVLQNGRVRLHIVDLNVLSSCVLSDAGTCWNTRQKVHKMRMINPEQRNGSRRAGWLHTEGTALGAWMMPVMWLEGDRGLGKRDTLIMSCYSKSRDGCGANGCYHGPWPSFPCLLGVPLPLSLREFPCPLLFQGFGGSKTTNRSLHWGNETSIRSFSDRSLLVDIRAACPFLNACFSGVHKRVVSKRVVLADVPWTPQTGMRVSKTEKGYQKPERGYICKTTLLQNRPCVSSRVFRGSNLRKLEGGGVEILDFQRPLKLTPFYRDSIENCQFVGQNSKSSRGNFRCESPPPLAFGAFWPPLSRSPIWSDFFRAEKNHDSHRRDRIWRDFLHWIFRCFLQILGGSSY